jgi:hypothetical protein
LQAGRASWRDGWRPDAVTSATRCRPATGKLLERGRERWVGRLGEEIPVIVAQVGSIRALSRTTPVTPRHRAHWPSIVSGQQRPDADPVPA